MPQQIDVIDLVDVTDDNVIDSHKRSHNESSSDSLRRTHRKTEGRVLFGEVMAQEREMERLHYERSRQHSTSSIELRKGDITIESPTKRLQQKRAEKRRSARQKRRRHLSPQSPVGGLPGGVSLIKLDGEESLPCKRPVTCEQDALHDASLHSTAWRNVKLKDAPENLLPDRVTVRQPFALTMDTRLDEFDADLKQQCCVSMEFLKAKPLTIESGSVGEVRDK